MIKKYVDEISAGMGIKLTGISIVEGELFGCRDSSLLNLTSGRQLVSAFIFHSELDELKNGADCNMLNMKISIALSRLKMLLELDE